MLFSEQQIKGISTELLVARKFIEYGYIVSIPYGNSSRYDLIVDTGIDRYRVQVKHASENSNGSFTIQTSNKTGTTAKRERKYYSRTDIDFIVSIIEDNLVVIPVELIEHTASKVFRVTLPKHGAKSTCNLIADFTVEKYIL